MSDSTELETAVAAALDKKALDVVLLDLRGLTSFTDYFLICHGTSPRQTQAIADAIEDALRKRLPLKGRVEGYGAGEWILMDYSELIVHVFVEEKRKFFNLERLWGDAPRIPVEDAAETEELIARSARPEASA